MGALLAAAGTALPGSDVAVAEGNSLGRGPLVYHLPQSAVDALLREGGSGGKPSAVQSRLELLRRAGCHALECGEADVRAAVQAHLEQQRRGKAPVPPAGAVQGAARPAAGTTQLAALMEVRLQASALWDPQLRIPRLL